MPYTSYKRTRRTPPRPKKRVRKAMGRVVSLRPRLPSFRVLRTTYQFNWVPGTATTGNFWQYLVFNLGMLNNVAEYTALFDTYRINSLKIQIRPRYTDVDQANTTKSDTFVHVVIDPKSATIPGGTYTQVNLNTLLENGRVRTYSGTKPITFKIKYPCVKQDQNGTADSTFERGRWYSTSKATIAHQGVHIFMQDANMSGNFGQSYDFFYTFDVIFRGQK